MHENWHSHVLADFMTQMQTWETEMKTQMAAIEAELASAKAGWETEKQLLLT